MRYKADEAHGKGFQGRYPDDESLLPRPVEESAKSRWAAFLTPTSRRNGSNKADKIVRQGNTHLSPRKPIWGKIERNRRR